MTPPVLLTFGFLTIAGLLKITGRLRSDLAALILLIVFGLSGLLPLESLFSGFSRSAVVLVIAIYMIAAGLEDTGALQLVSRLGLGRGAGGGRRSIARVMLLAAGLSLGLNTVVVVGLLLPGVTAMARRSRMAPARLLLPLSYGALLGGMATLFTTANILASAALVDQGLPALTMVDFLPGGVLIAVVGILFVTLVGPRLLPATLGHEQQVVDPHSPLTDLYALPDQVKALYVGPQSRLGDVSLADGALSRRLGLSVVGLSRGGVIRLAPAPEERIRVGDVIYVIGRLVPEALAEHGLFPTDDPDWSGRLAAGGIRLVEAVPAPWSGILGKTLRDLAFRDTFGLNVLSIWREGNAVRDALSDLPIQPGDALLLQGRSDRIALLRKDPDFLVLDEDSEPPAIGWRAHAAIALALGALLLPAINLLPVAEAAFLTAVTMVLLGCTSIERAYRAVDWKTVFTIAAIMPISLVLTGTGAAAWLAGTIGSALGPIGQLGVGATFFISAAALTQVVGGRVTAILLAPVAIATGGRIGVDPRVLAMVVAWASSTAFLTPNAHAANRLILGPGDLRRRDFIRVGLPLTLLVLGAVLVILAL